MAAKKPPAPIFWPEQNQKLQSSLQKAEQKAEQKINQQPEQPEKKLSGPEPKSDPQQTGITGKVAAMLQGQPMVLQALYRALKSKGFLLRLSWYEVADPTNHPELDLQHHFENSNFAKKDVLPVMQHQKLDYIKKHDPDIDIASVQCPHCNKMMPDQRGFI